MGPPECRSGGGEVINLDYIKDSVILLSLDNNEDLAIIAFTDGGLSFFTTIKPFTLSIELLQDLIDYHKTKFPPEVKDD